MSTEKINNSIHYVEFTTTDIARTKEFYGRVFGWSFQDWGPDYIDFTAGVSGGFKKAEGPIVESPNAPLVVLYAADLAATEAAVVAAGGKITVPVFEFPGGRRFHFSDGLGNTLAVWSE